MPRNGSGTYSLPSGNPVITDTLITSVWANTTMSDIGTELTNSLARNGAGGMTGPLRLTDGTVTVPALAFNSETTMGIYRIGASQIGFSTVGTLRLTLSSTDLISTLPVTAPALIPNGTTVPVNGMYLAAANQVTFATNTTLRLTLSTTDLISTLPATAPAHIVNGSTVPANGIYLPSANTLGFASNTVARGSINSTGNWAINAPSSGTTLAVTNATNTDAVTATDGTVTGYVAGFSSTTMRWGPSSNHGFALYTNNTSRFTISNAGNAALAAPASGTALAITSVASANAVSVTDGTANSFWFSAAGSGVFFGLSSNHPLIFQTNNATRYTIAAAGNHVFAASASGTTLTATSATDLTGIEVTGSVNNVSMVFSNTGTGGVSNWRASATNNSSGFGGGLLVIGQGSNQYMTFTTAAGPKVKVVDSIGTMFNAGFLEAPQNVQNATYTTVLADSGKHIYHTSGSVHTWTIDSNANVAYPIGTVLTFVNENAGGNVTIAITSDTLRLAPGGGTGSRTLAANGRATAIKVTTTGWQITGVNLT